MQIRELTKQEREYKDSILGIKTINIHKSDFTKTNSYAIQQMYCEHYFKNISQSDLLTASDVNVSNLNELIRKIKQSGRFNDIFNYKPDGIGPGEVMMYFLIADSQLGGQNERGDLTVGNTKYEIKVPEIMADGKTANDVRIAGGGGTPLMRQVMKELADLERTLKITGGLKYSNLMIMKKADEKSYNLMEKKFKEGVAEYFSGKKVIIIKGNGSERGQVMKIIDKVTEDMVSLYRVTGSEFKASIKL